MNEQAIIDSYNLFASRGYNGSIDDFKQLIASNPDALNDSYSIFKTQGYSEDIESYKELMGLKKKAPEWTLTRQTQAAQAMGARKMEQEAATPQPQPTAQAQPMAQKPQAPVDMASSSGASSSASPSDKVIVEEFKGFDEDALKRMKASATEAPQMALMRQGKKAEKQREEDRAQVLAEIETWKGYKEEPYFEGELGNTIRAIPFGLGGFIDDMGRAYGAGATQADIASPANMLMISGASSSPEQIKKYVETAKVSNKYGPSEEMVAFTKAIEEDNGGAWGFIKGLIQNPSVVPEVMISSTRALFNSASAAAAGTVVGTAAAGGTAFGGVGAGAAALASIPYAMGTAGATLETASSFAEFMNEELQRRGLELSEENVKTILEDEDALSSIRNRALTRGVTIGVIDAFTGRIAGRVGAKLGKGVGTAAKIKAGLAGAGIEAVGGAGGEATARALAGQEMDIAEIGLEGIGEMPMATIDIAAEVLRSPRYKINGEVRSAEDVENIINTASADELQKINFDIRNDKNGFNEKIQDKIVTNQVKNEIRDASPDIDDESLNQLTTLEMELRKVEGNKTQTGRDKANQIRSQIREVQQAAAEKKAAPSEAPAVAPSEAPAITYDQLSDEAKGMVERELDLYQSNIDNAKENNREPDERDVQQLELLKSNPVTFLEQVVSTTTNEERKTLAEQALIKIKEEQDAIQKQTAGQVPVQPTTRPSQEVAQGEPQAEPQGTPQAGVEEEVARMEQLFGEPEQVEANLELREEQKLSNLNDKVAAAQKNIARADDAELAIEEYNKAKKERDDFEASIQERKQKEKSLKNIESLIEDERAAAEDSRYEYRELFDEDPRLALIQRAKDMIEFAQSGDYESALIKQGVSPEQAKKDVQRAIDRETRDLADLESDIKARPSVSLKTQQGQGVSVSNKSQVAQLETKTTDTNKKKIIKAATTAINTLKSIFPDMDIVIHESNDSYTKQVGQSTRGNFSVTRTADGKIVGGRIDINLSKANMRTVAHEVAHAVMLKAFGDNPALFKVFRDRITNILNETRVKALNDFASRYAEDESHEEFLVELSAVLTENEQQLKPTTVQKIAELINKVVSKITGGKVQPFSGTVQTNELIDFLNTMSAAIGKGEAIQVKEAVELNTGGEVGTFNIVSKAQLAAPKATEDSRSFIRDLVQDIDIREFNGMPFVTNMYDYTNAGVTDLGNGFTINMMGGKSYVPYIMSLQNKKIGDVSNLSAFNSKENAEAFIRNALSGKASLFAPHSGTMSESWQFQQHTFSELVNLVLDKNILTNDELINAFNKTIASNADNIRAFEIFNQKYKEENISNFDSFKSNPKKIVELLDIQNNFSPDLRKALNNAIAADKIFQKAIGIKNKEQFFERIMDPLNKGVVGGEIISVVKFDPKTLQVVKTDPNNPIDHHPSFGWAVLAKIDGIYQPSEFHKSSNVTKTYTKYNKGGKQVSRKANEPDFEKKNVSSSAGAIPKVAKFSTPKKTEGGLTTTSKAQVDDVAKRLEGVDVATSNDELFNKIKGSKWNSIPYTLEQIVKKWDELKSVENDNINTIKYLIDNPSKNPIVLNSKGDLIDGYHRVVANKILGISKVKYVFDDGSFDINEPFVGDINKNIASAYVQAKADGSNPELVKAVEDVIGKPSVAEEVKEMGETFTVSKAQVDAYHGSPYDFDRFTTEKMGTGEGAQAFGWGLYFTDLKSIAETYAKKLAKTTFMGEAFDENPMLEKLRIRLDDEHSNFYNQYSGSITNISEFKDYLDDQYEYLLAESQKPIDENHPMVKRMMSDNDYSKEKIDNARNTIAEFKSPEFKEKIKKLNEVITDESLKKVFLSDFIKSEKFAISFLYEAMKYWSSRADRLSRTINFVKNDIKRDLNYFKYLRDNIDKFQSSKKLYQVTLHQGKTPDQYTWLEWDKPVSEKIANVLEKAGVPSKINDKPRIGSDVYEGLATRMGPKEASLFLLKAGIDGIKYPAESIARGATSETARGFNYVVFDENAVTIISKAQKGGDEIRKIIKDARAQGFSEEAIKAFLIKKGITAQEADTLMAKPEAGKKIELGEELMEGYDRMMAEVDGIIERGLNRNAKQETILANVLKNVEESDAYKNGTDIQREQIVREVKQAFGEKMKTAPSVGKILGTIKDIKKITMSETKYIRDRYTDMTRAVKDHIKAWKKANKQLMAELKDMVRSGKINTAQAAAILGRFSKTNLLNQDSIDSFIQYMARVFADANYAERISNIRKNLKNAKRNIGTKIGVAESIQPLLQRMLSINPTAIPESVFDKYEALVEMLGQRKAVLELRDIDDVRADVTAVMDAVDAELSKVPDLADRFENYSDKVLDEDGKVQYSETVDKMLEENLIDADEAAIMRKYKSKIMPAAPKAKMTEAEIAQEKQDLIAAIKATTIDPSKLALRDERDSAKQLEGMIDDAVLEKMDNKQLKTLLAVIGNINNGYMPHQAQIIKEVINAKKKQISKSVIKAKPLPLSRAYNKLKAMLFRKTTDIYQMIASNPLFNIDEVLGNFKTKDIFNALFQDISKASATYDAAMTAIRNRLDDAYTAVSKSFGNNPAEVNRSSYRMMAYMLQLEHQTNPAGVQTKHSAMDYLEKTIAETEKGNTPYSDADIEMFKEILSELQNLTDADGNVDLDAFYSKFNQAEKNAIKVIQEVNIETRDKALYTSAVIRGDRITPLNNYVHHSLFPDNQPDETITNITTSQNVIAGMNPSTKGKSLIARTGALSAMNFDVFTATQRGANFVMLDYYMTEPVRTAHRMLNETERALEEEYGGKVPKEQRDVFNAIRQAFETAKDDYLTNQMVQDSLLGMVSQEIARQGYRAMLASVPRFAAELLSNMTFVMVNDPSAMATGTALTSVVMSSDAPSIMINLMSKQTNRVFSNDTLSGRLVDRGILNETTTKGSQGTKNGVVNKVQQIYNNSAKKVKNSMELLADTLISTPDKMMIRPFWFGAFANEFERITGKKPDFDKIASNDEAYMSENKEALDAATAVADNKSTMAGATDNAFMGILKGNIRVTDDSYVKFFKMFNSFMSRFLVFEYTSARTAVYAAMGKGYLNKRQGAALLAAVTLRMTLYTLIFGILSQYMMELFTPDDEEEDEKSLKERTYQAMAQGFNALVLGRNFGNFTKGMINYGVEWMNENYLDFLREGEYDPYKDKLAYSFIPEEKKGQQSSIFDFTKNMLGPYTPLIKSLDFSYQRMREAQKRAAQKAEEEARPKEMFEKGKSAKELEDERIVEERKKKEMSIRIPLEVFGSLGYIPLYRDVRKIIMNKIYKDLKEAKVQAEKNKAQREADKAPFGLSISEYKRYFPKEYEARYGKGSEYYYRNEAEDAIIDAENAERKRMLDAFFNYVPKQKIKKSTVKDEDYLWGKPEKKDKKDDYLFD